MSSNGRRLRGGLTCGPGSLVCGPGWPRPAAVPTRPTVISRRRSRCSGPMTRRLTGHCSATRSGGCCSPGATGGPRWSNSGRPMNCWRGFAPERFREPVQAALALCGVRPADHAVQSPLTLTDRERDVAVLVAKGMTNREVAAELYVSVKAVEYHLRHVFDK